MDHLYRNPALTPKERTLDLLSLMTIEEKIGQMMQVAYTRYTEEEALSHVTEKFTGSFLHVLGDNAKRLQEAAATTRLGIPLIFGIDAIHGHAFHEGATIFPSQLAMSCSWNPELVQAAGRATAKEVAADGLHWTFSPVCCIGRDLRWGRINETFGEDPYLIGVMASAIIRGYQGDNLSDEDSILACAKHYLGYGESTGGRDSYDTEVTLRKIREVFLPPFKAAAEAGCATFMTGYQSIDGNPLSSNKTILRNLLKDEIGFNGFVVTDWNNAGSLVSTQHVASDASAAAKMSIESGNDMIMNTPEFYDAAVELAKKGLIPEVMIDDAVKRILYIKFAMGLFDNKRFVDLSSKSSVYACPEHLHANIKLARESAVLLENRNNTLPLEKSVKKIAVIGPNADDIVSQLGDWTVYTHFDVKPKENMNAYTMLSGIKEIAMGKAVEVAYHKGCDVMDIDDKDIAGAVKVASESDLVVAIVGDCIAQNGEFKDRADLTISGAQLELLQVLKSCGKPLVVVLVNGKPLAIPWIAQNADALIETFNSGLFGGKVLAEILWGETNPSGKLSISFANHSGQLPVYYNQLPGWHGGKYMDMPTEPLYSFGYGLSYSNFNYSNLNLSNQVCTKHDNITVSVDVTNSSSVDGLETVQLYIRDLVSSVMTPVKALKGFKKVLVRAGETITVEIPLEISNLAIVDSEENYVVEPGDFELMVGTDSRDSSLLKTILTIK